MKPSDSPSWTFYSRALILTLTLFQALQWDLLPRFLDIYYHLSVMKGFEQAGGYVTRAFWEYAPEGRPHLYPPLLHVWMWMLSKTGLDPIDVGRFVDCVSFPALLTAWHHAVRRLYSARTAFWALLLFASAYSLALASVTLSAFNLAFLLGLLALSEAEKGSRLRAGLLLALCFYAHTLGALLFSLAMALNAAFSPDKRRGYLAALGLAALLASPFLFYQWQYRGYFAFVKVKENNLLRLDLAVYSLLVPALASVRALKKQANTRWALCLLAAMVPLVFTHQTRFFGGHGMAGAALLAGLWLDRWSEKMPKAVPLALVFAAFLSPQFEWDLKTGQKTLIWADRTLTRTVWAERPEGVRPNSFAIYFREPYEEIASVIREHSGEEDVLWTDFSYTAGIFGVMTGRAASCGMLAETKPFEEVDRLSDAKVVVWFRDRDGLPRPEMRQSAERRGWKLLRETEMAFVFENPSGGRKRRIPPVVVPAFWLALLGALTLAVPTSLFLPKKPK